MERVRRWAPVVSGLVAALLVIRIVPAWWCGRDAAGWFRGDPQLQRGLADELVAFEAQDDASRRAGGAHATGQWALVTHQMIALGLAQVCQAHPDWLPRYRATITGAALKTWLPEMRGFGTEAWLGEDGLAQLDGPSGHAYLGYPALAVSVARVVDPAFPAAVAAAHDAVIAALERRLLASPTGAIETYPGDAYPTDVAAVAAAIAVHGRATGTDHAVVLAHWAAGVAAVQIDPASGLGVQRLGAQDGRPHDVPRGPGPGLAAYFPGYVDRAVAARLADALVRHESTLAGFGAIREFADGYDGLGDVDSGPVVLGVSVAATGFALGPARAFGHRGLFTRLFRTTELFGLAGKADGRVRFATGGALGNALLLAMLTSGPELAP